MNTKGGKHTTDSGIERILNPRVSGERAVCIGRMLWRRGLLIQAIIKRVEREMAEMQQRRTSSLKRAGRVKVNRTVINRANMNKAKAKREAERARELADQGTRFPL